MTRGGLRDGVALERRQSAGRMRKAPVQAVIQLVPGDDLGDRLRRRPRPEEPTGQTSGSARWDDDGARVREIERSLHAQGGDRATEAVEIGNADEARPAGGDHFGNWGILSSACISLRARATSMSDPAAAADASHARVMLPVSAASRRMRAALSASSTALMSSECVC
jgi:hypothetical protein